MDGCQATVHIIINPMHNFSNKKTIPIPMKDAIFVDRSLALKQI
jgi:hypothetical protein